ncbi:MAG: hypothetical protein IT558_06300 [Alphaproteobacteria bacterium]|nr:hypothetical protein [Alphaproteobacteria bacterium]
MLKTFRQHYADLYRNRRKELFTYILILLLSIAIGLWAAWFFRGKISFARDLMAMTFGYSVPAGAIIFITRKVNQALISRGLDFLIGILICVIIGLCIQWGFFKMGKHTYGAQDFANAIYLCEQSKDYVLENREQFLFSQAGLPTTLPGGEKIELGNIWPPLVFYVQERSYKDGVFDVESIFMCRFMDPREVEYSPQSYYTYNYKTGEWYVGY